MAGFDFLSANQWHGSFTYNYRHAFFIQVGPVLAVSGELCSPNIHKWVNYNRTHTIWDIQKKQTPDYEYTH